MQPAFVYFFGSAQPYSINFEFESPRALIKAMAQEGSNQGWKAAKTLKENSKSSAETRA